MISGVGGSILGYNMFAYCQNNPVNMNDEDGNRGKLFKEIVNRIKYVAKMIVKTVAAPFKATKVSVGAGTGIGVNGSVTIKNVKVEGGVSKSTTGSVVYDKGKVGTKSTTSIVVGVSVADTIGFLYSKGKELYLGDSNCHCDFWTTSYKDQSRCLANKEFEIVEPTIGISGGMSLGIGVEASVGIDVRALHDDLISVFSEPYVSCY